jgi:hypothetical protein
MFDQDLEIASLIADEGFVFRFVQQSEGRSAVGHLPGGNREAQASGATQWSLSALSQE